ncbi:MAG: hypothetical protein RMK29_01180 [Myxococcales bacterium]|nr:hypothetical protein [Myxococcota bacterium]MDW8280290.1 hypothetical protein [Myxococcales bacterium]
MTTEDGSARCRCGHDRTHPLVVPEPRYGLGGWLLLGLGATPRPREIAFRCTRCQQVLAISRDPEDLRRLA